MMRDTCGLPVQHKLALKWQVPEREESVRKLIWMSDSTPGVKKQKDINT